MARRELGSYNSPATVVSDGVHAFLNGLVYGSVWGLFAPYYAPGTAGAAAGTFHTHESSTLGFHASL